jgi:hypothetical protein
MRSPDEAQTVGRISGDFGSAPHDAGCFAMSRPPIIIPTGSWPRRMCAAVQQAIAGLRFS